MAHEEPGHHDQTEPPAGNLARTIAVLRDRVMTTVTSLSHSFGRLMPTKMAPILVVDDDAKILRLVRTYLEREGFAVITASDGRSALAAVRESRPRLLVLDVMRSVGVESANGLTHFWFSLPRVT